MEQPRRAGSGGASSRCSLDSTCAAPTGPAPPLHFCFRRLSTGRVSRIPLICGRVMGEAVTPPPFGQMALRSLIPNGSIVTAALEGSTGVEAYEYGSAQKPTALHFLSLCQIVFCNCAPLVPRLARRRSVASLAGSSASEEQRASLGGGEEVAVFGGPRGEVPYGVVAPCGLGWG